MLTEVISVDEAETADVDSLTRRLEKQVQMMQTDVIWVRCSKVTAPFWRTHTADDTRHCDVQWHQTMSWVTQCSCHGISKTTLALAVTLPVHKAAESTVLWPTCCHSMITGTNSALNDTSRKCLSVLVQPVTRRTNRYYMTKSKRLLGDWPMGPAITPCVNTSIIHAGVDTVACC